MVRKRVTTAVAVSAAVVISLLAAGPAQAKPAVCAVSATIPAKVAYAGVQSVVRTSLSDPAGCLDWAHYQLVRSDGTLVGGNVYDSKSLTSNFSLSASSDGPGRYQLIFDDGYSTVLSGEDRYSTIAVSGGSSDWLTAKYASKTSLAAPKREQSKVTLSATVKRYSSAEYEYVAWRAAKVRFQFKRDGEWVTAKTARANARGVATASVAGGKRLWRAISVETSTVWAKASHERKG